MPRISLGDFDEQPSSGLSEGAKVLLRHFRDNKIPQLAYEYPATLEALFADPEDCERAQEELGGLGLVELGRSPPAHIPTKSRVRAMAINLEGERYIASNDLK